MEYTWKVWVLLVLAQTVMLLPEKGSAQGNTFRFEYYSQEDGLSNNQVHCSFQDKRGFMWFGTSQGISRFDGYRFTRFVNQPGDTSSLKGNLVRVIFENSQGELFVGTENGGLNLFDRDKELFRRIFDRFPDLGADVLSVNDILEDKSGRLWIGTDRGLLLSEEGKIPEWVNPSDFGGDRKFAGNFIRVMTFDTSGNLWMGTNHGVFVLDTANNRVSPLPLPDPFPWDEEVWELALDPEGKIWIGTYENGIFIISPEGIWQHILPDPENPRSRTVRSIARDKKGDYWIGTRGGLYIYNPEIGIIATYQHDEREAKSLSGNSILDIFHDIRGDTWIGTRTGINYLVHSKQVFHNFRAMPNDSLYLNSNEVWAFWTDTSGKIWVGTEDGGVNIFDPIKETFRYLRNDPDNPGSLSSNCIKSFLDDGDGNLWIATYLGGINVLNLQSGKISHHRNNPGDPRTISDDRVWCLYRDSRKTIWAASSSGVDWYDPATKTFHNLKIIPSGTQVNWINEDNAGNLWIGGREELYIYTPESGKLITKKEQSRAFWEDKKGRIWIATIDKGLALYSAAGQSIRYYTEKEGLANNQSISILEDNNGFLWIGTTNGLSRMNPETGFIQTFSGKDGLQNSQFNYGAALKCPSGELLFGGISGFNLFDPLRVTGNEFIPPMVFTDLRIFNKSAEIGEGKKKILHKSITETREIVLPFRQKVITFEFAALNYVNPQTNLYSYFLEGFDQSWNDPSPFRTATYTNLNPGEYTLWVKSVIPGIPDAGNEIALKMKVLPPFWRTWIFKIILFLFIASLLYGLLAFVLYREKLRNEVAFERIKAGKLHDLDMLKLKFFTNISHEIKTPLTLILGPMEQLRSGKVSPEQGKQLLDIMHRNARHLHQLINQILDFRKLEEGNLKLELTDGDLVGFIRGIAAQFDHLAREKEIRYRLHTLVSELSCRFDPEKVEKIVCNLLSNAFKFTDKGGRITLSLAVAFDSKELRTDGFDEVQRTIELTVKDSGKGISDAYIDKIFNRFFRSGDSTDVPGTGIGLALVKELVKLHEGEIVVTSKPGLGSRFKVILPLWEPGSKSPENSPDIESQPAEKIVESNPNAAERNCSGLMLIVEDNPDVRLFICTHFEQSFRVMEASDGTEGWEVAIKTLPDIVLCDVLMPRTDGNELLKRLKNDARTSHIPVILLTALGSKEHEMAGLLAGADDYITKPFDISLLEKKVNNLLSIRRSLKEKYSEEIFLQPENVQIQPPDEKFLKKAIETVERNIGNPDLDIKRFAAEIGVSRMQLYRKLDSLTHMTVGEFIRDIRLKRSAQLLLQKKQTISEITFAVGFRDVSHFRKCFKRKFGMSASDYCNQHEANPS